MTQSYCRELRVISKDLTTTRKSSSSGTTPDLKSLSLQKFLQDSKSHHSTSHRSVSSWASQCVKLSYHGEGPSILRCFGSQQRVSPRPSQTYNDNEEWHCSCRCFRPHLSLSDPRAWNSGLLLKIRLNIRLVPKTHPKTLLDFACDSFLHVEARSLLLPSVERSVLPPQPLDSQGRGLLSVSPMGLQVTALHGNSKLVPPWTSEDKSQLCAALQFSALLTHDLCIKLEHYRSHVLAPHKLSLIQRFIPYPVHAMPWPCIKVTARKSNRKKTALEFLMKALCGPFLKDWSS